MKSHHWKGLKPDPDNYYGFLYIITNNVTGKKYIGRKFYHRYSKRKVAGESNWRSYTGSCKPLNEDIKKLGKDNFTFEIFKQYKTRGGVVYYECNYQHKFDVLTAKDDEGNRLWYNNNIGAIKFIPKEDVSDETREKLRVAGRGARYEAQQRGDKFYDGRKCSKCGTTRRYTCYAQCVECSRRQQQDAKKRKRKPTS